MLNEGDTVFELCNQKIVFFQTRNYGSTVKIVDCSGPDIFNILLEILPDAFGPTTTPSFFTVNLKAIRPIDDESIENEI